MPLYTFIANYKGGIYYSQVVAPNSSAAVILWAENLDVKIISGFGKKAKRKMIDKIRRDEGEGFGHCPLNTFNHFWFFLIRVKRSTMLVNFVQTVEVEAEP